LPYNVNLTQDGTGARSPRSVDPRPPTLLLLIVSQSAIPSIQIYRLRPHKADADALAFPLTGDDWNDNTQCCEPPSTPSGHAQVPVPKPQDPKPQPGPKPQPKPEPKPQPKPDPKPKPNDPWHHKRAEEERVQADVKLRAEEDASSLVFAQDELNAMYCPGRLQAW